MMIVITDEQLYRLQDGEPPWEIDKSWDCASVIVALAVELVEYREESEE